MQPIKFIFFIFLFFGILTVAAALNFKINKLSVELKESNDKLYLLNKQLKESYTLIGEIDSTLNLPE